MAQATYDFIFNSDNSYSAHFAESVEWDESVYIDAPRGQFKKTIIIDLDNYKDVTLLEWDEENNFVIDMEPNTFRLSTEEGIAKLESFLVDQLEYLTKEDNPESWEEAVILAQLAGFDDQKMTEIFGDGILDDDEVQQIINELS